MIHQVSQLLNDFNSKKLLAVPEPHFAAVQFLMMVQGESRMRAVLNIESIPDDEMQRYLASCVNLFLRAHAPDNTIQALNQTG